MRTFSSLFLAISYGAFSNKTEVNDPSYKTKTLECNQQPKINHRQSAIRNP